MKNQFKASLLLLISAAIWGFAFVAQSKGMEYIGPMTLSTIRCFLGGSLILLTHKINFIRKIVLNENSILIDAAATRRGGIICGILLFFAMNIQQYGILETTAGKAGFITTLYIIIIPIIMFFRGHKISKKILVCIGIAILGMYLLSVTEELSINKGDLTVFLSAIFFSVHMIALANYSHKTNAIKLNAYQFYVCGILSFFSMLIMEDINIEGIKMAMAAILYISILSSAVAFTCQIIALRYIDTTLAALISSMESIFAAIGGYLILKEILTTREVIGCILMFIATIIAQLRIGNNEEEIQN